MLTLGMARAQAVDRPSGPAAGPAAAAASDAGLLRALIEDAADFSHRDRPALPHVVRLVGLSAAAFEAEVCAGQPHPCERIVAAYDPRAQRVLYRESLDLAASHWDRSFIVHELVHWLQHRARGLQAPAQDCHDEWKAEREAYVAQNRYLYHHKVARRVGQALKFVHCPMDTPAASAPAAKP